MDELAIWGPGIARVVMGAVYLLTAAGLIKDFAKVTELMAAKGVPMQAALLGIVIVVWVLCGGALVIGRMVIPAALLLFALTLLITPVIHNFWAAPPELQANEIQHFSKNVAILAGLLAIATLASTSPM